MAVRAAQHATQQEPPARRPRVAVARCGAVVENGVNRRTTLLVVGDGFTGHDPADFWTGKAAKAVHWYNISAHAGFAPSMHRLGNAYAAGEGVPAADLRQAAAWLERAVLVTHSISSHQGTKGNATLWGGPSVSSRAAFDLAKLLLRGVENGWPSPFPDEAVDPRERAAELLATAAAEGHARAQQTLAMLGRGECDGSSAWSSGVLGVGVSGGDASAGSRLVVTGTSTTATGRF